MGDNDSVNNRSSPIEDRLEYQRQADALPEGQQELTRELTRHADICRFFDERDMQVPPHIVRALQEARSMPVPERTEAIRQLNLELMAYLENVSEDPEFRM